MHYPFQNEPFTDFNRPENDEAFREALARVCSTLGKTYPLVIGGEKIETAETFASTNPAAPDQVVGRMAKAGVDLANRAVEAADAAFESLAACAVRRAGRLSVRSRQTDAAAQARVERLDGARGRQAVGRSRR